MKKQQIGVIGLAVMGKNLALNIESRGFGVSVFNRSAEKTREMLAEAGGKNIVGVYCLRELVESLESPRKIIIMVKAGQPVDAAIDALLPLLSVGDIVIDGGNSFYKDTVARTKRLQKHGICFIGMGVSGGEEGALYGPALMPGGSKDAYAIVEPILTAIAAKVDNDACCVYVGPDGSGHFVKMVHNGIEYADMQLICEAYDILRNMLGMQVTDMRAVFKDWNNGELQSFLIEITADILGKIDEETGAPLVDMILDTAEHKGTGKWTSETALDLGVPVPTITEAVFQRYISASKPQRVAASGVLAGPSFVASKGQDFTEAVRQALYAGKICAYAQGFALLSAASDAYGWDIKPDMIAMILRGGCIIRARFLNDIMHAFNKNPRLGNLLLDKNFAKSMERCQQPLRDVVAAAVQAGTPVPGMASALAYFDSLRAANLPMNLIQAQRDYFGAHTYRRTDKPGVFHTQWQS